MNFNGIRLSAAELGAFANQQFKDKYNGQVKSNFQSTLNMKVGAEIRVSSSWSLRGGVARYGQVFASNYDSIDRTQFQLSAGVGYRTNGYYLDLGVWQRTGNEAYTPYTLKNAAEYSSAALKITNMQILLGGGVYF
jgi:long-subunit fatty acid transport protein